MRLLKIDNALRFLLVAAFFLVTSCSTTNHVNQTLDQKISVEKKEEKPPLSPEEDKLRRQKFWKEGARMLTMDLIIAAVCEPGLHFSFGACLAISLASDFSIIIYSNKEIDWANQKDQENLERLRKLKKENPNFARTPAALELAEAEKPKAERKKTPLFEPLDFAVSFSLTVLTLLLF